MQKLRRFLGSLWKWTATFHTGWWVLERLGLAGFFICGDCRSLAFVFTRTWNWFIIGGIFVISAALLIVPPIITRRDAKRLDRKSAVTHIGEVSVVAQQPMPGDIGRLPAR